MAGAKLTSPGRPASYWRTECHPKVFRDAYRDFIGWFKHVTGIEWDNRLDNLPFDPDKFRYTPPDPSRPVGSLPYEKRHLLLERMGDNKKDGKGDVQSQSDPKDDTESEEEQKTKQLKVISTSKSNGCSNIGDSTKETRR